MAQLWQWRVFICFKNVCEIHGRIPPLFIGYGCWVQACHLLLIARNWVFSQDPPDTHWIWGDRSNNACIVSFLNPIWIQNSCSSDGIYKLKAISHKMGTPCSKICQKRPYSYSDAITKLFIVEINGLHRLLRHNWDIYIPHLSELIIAVKWIQKEDI